MRIQDLQREFSEKVKLKNAEAKKEDSHEYLIKVSSLVKKDYLCDRWFTSIVGIYCVLGYWASIFSVSWHSFSLTTVQRDYEQRPYCTVAK
jgi:hypothetical protein